MAPVGLGAARIRERHQDVVDHHAAPRAADLDIDAPPGQRAVVPHLPQGVLG